MNCGAGEGGGRLIILRNGEYYQESKWRKANWIGHILSRKCLIKQVIERKIEERIEVTARRGRRLKQLLDDLKEKTENSKLKRKH